MSVLTDHARGIADALATTLAEMEVPADSNGCRAAILRAWLSVVDDVERGSAALSSNYLADVHRRLVSAAGASESDGFAEHGLPILPDGSRESWTRFAEECGYLNAEGDEEVYALAQLRWGQHVQTFALTLGWFAMNILLLLRGNYAIHPVSADREVFLRDLSFAGPADYDAENLRSLIGEYVDGVRQHPSRSEST
jgi:hypothetical protein